MRNKILIIIYFLIFLVCFIGCEDNKTSYAGFLDLPDFNIWGKEVYDIIIVSTKTDKELLDEGFSEEQIMQFREVNIDDEIKRIATYPADMLGTTVQNSIIFKQYVDNFYDEDISYYILSDLVQLSNDDLKNFFGYSDEECNKLRILNDASVYPEKYSEEELSELGLSQEEIENLQK